MVSRIESSFIRNPEVYRFDEPSLMFTPQGESVQYPLDGLTTFGPLDWNGGGRSFNEIRIVVFCNQEDEYRQKLQMVTDKLALSLQKEYRILKTDVEFLDSPYPESLTSADADTLVRNLLPDARLDIKSPLRTIVVWPGPDHVSIKDLGHRILTKRSCIRMGVPTQYVSYHQSGDNRGILATVDSDSFSYAVRGLALGVYGKVGGVTWALRQSELGPSGVDSVAGFRFVRARNEERGKFVIGALSVFGKHGRLYGFESTKFSDVTPSGKRWLAYSDSAHVGIEDSQVMTEHLLDIHRSRVNKNPNHLVIHRLGPYHPDEVIGITKVLEEEQIEKYALLEIIRDNHFRLFGESDDGVQSPPRGLAWRLSGESILLSTTGDVDYETVSGETRTKDHRLGTPNPILINIRTSSNSYTNPFEAAQNVFVLTALHWGSLFSKEIHLPVTLRFAHLIASMYRDGVEPHPCLSGTPWFL